MQAEGRVHNAEAECRGRVRRQTNQIELTTGHRKQHSVPSVEPICVCPHMTRGYAGTGICMGKVEGEGGGGHRGLPADPVDGPAAGPAAWASSWWVPEAPEDPDMPSKYISSSSPCIHTCNVMLHCAVQAHGLYACLPARLQE